MVPMYSFLFRLSSGYESRCKMNHRIARAIASTARGKSATERGTDAKQVSHGDRGAALELNDLVAGMKRPGGGIDMPRPQI